MSVYDKVTQRESVGRSSEVAANLRVNESRVSQIKTRAISKLRLQLEPRNYTESRIVRL